MNNDELGGILEGRYLDIYSDEDFDCPKKEKPRDWSLKLRINESDTFKIQNNLTLGPANFIKGF